MGNDLVSKSPAELIAAAVSKDTDLDKLKGLLEIQKDWEANEARKAYHQAMAAFKVNAPAVTKDKVNSQFDSKYTSLNNLVNTVNPVLSQNGLTASWDIEQNGTIKVTCKLTHILGHSECSSMSAEADTSGAKNKIQQIKSAVTYLKSVTFESICGLASTDANLDDDGNSAAVETISEQELQTIEDNLIAKDISEDRLLKLLKVESLSKIKKTDYQRALTAIKNSKGGT